MELIQNSKDLLNIVLAFCVLWLTIFLAWFIYYLAMMMKQFFQIIKEMRARINKVDEVIDNLKEKIEHGASYISLLGDGAKKLVEVAKEHMEEKPKKRVRKKK